MYGLDFQDVVSAGKSQNSTSAELGSCRNPKQTQGKVQMVITQWAVFWPLEVRLASTEIWAL